MTFDQFLTDLNAEQLEAYAQRCGTSALYLRNHLLGASRAPRLALLNKLWQESGEKLTRQDVLDHFFPGEGGQATQESP